MIQLQRIRRGVGARLASLGTARGGEVLSFLVAEVAPGRLQVRPVSLSLEAIASDGDQVVTDAVAAGLAQEPLDDPFAFFISALAELVMADPSPGVGDVHGRPVPVGEGIPDCVVAVERDRILDAHVLHGPADILDVPFEREFWGVDANHNQAVILVLLSPRADVAERAQPIDAGVGPEVDENDLAPQVRRGERGRVEPAGRPVEARQVTLGGRQIRVGAVVTAEQAHATPPPTSSTASAKACGASCGRLCLIGPEMEATTV